MIDRANPAHLATLTALSRKGNVYIMCDVSNADGAQSLAEIRSAFSEIIPLHVRYCLFHSFLSF